MIVGRKAKKLTRIKHFIGLTPGKVFALEADPTKQKGKKQIQKQFFFSKKNVQYGDWAQAQAKAHTHTHTHVRR